MKRLHLSRVFVLTLTVVIWLAPISAQNASRMEVLSVAGKPVEAENGVVIDIVRAGEAFDVEVGCYGVPDNHNVWLLLKARDGREYNTFGPAKRQRREAGDICLIADVPISVLSGQRRLFHLRLASVARGQAVPPTITTLNAFDAVSTPPTQIAVLRSVPDLGELRITTITGLTAEPGRELSVDGNGDLVGVKPAGAERVYVVIHDVNTDVSRVVGPADVHGSTWHMQDVALRQPGFPHWRLVDVFAFTTATPTPLGGRDYASVHDRVTLTSQPVRLWLKDEVAPPAVRAPLVTFARYGTVDGQSARISGSDLKIQLTAPEFSLSGSVEGLPQGRALFLVSKHSSTPMWTVVPGAALLLGTEWTFPKVRLVAMDPLSTVHEVYVIAANPSIPTGLVDYDTWRRHAIGISPRLAVETRGARTVTRPDIAIRLVSVINGVAIATATEVPADHYVCVGRLIPGTQYWEFVPASRSSDDTFTAAGLPHVALASANGNSETFVAIVTNSVLPSLRLETFDWQQRAVAVSPLLSLPVGEPVSGPTARLLSNVPTLQKVAVWLVTLLLLVCVLGVLQHLLGIVAPVFHFIAETFRRLREYLRSQLSHVPVPKAVPSAISVLLLTVGVVMTVGYLPVYEDVMRSALALSRRSARSVALLIVLSLVMVGLVTHITNEYGRRRNPDGSMKPAGFGYVFALTFIGLMGAAILAFQALIYYEFYSSHAAEGSLIPIALGTAAFFISATEMINSYWVLQLGIEFYTWLAIHVAVGPLWIAEHLSRLLEKVFLAVPTRPQAPPPTLKEA